MKKTKLKILFIISTVDIGGAEVLLLNMCRGLLEIDRHFEISILTFFKGNALRADFEKIGITVTCLELPKTSSIKGFIKKNLALYLHIKKKRPDIVHTQLLDTDRYGQIAAFLAGVKIRICTVHNIELDELPGYKTTRFVTGLLATKIIFVAKCAMEHYCSLKSYPSKKCIAVNNAPGFKEKDFSPKIFDCDKKVIKIVNIGRLQLQKGQLFLIRSMKLLENASHIFELDIYGGDYDLYQSSLEKERDDLDIRNVVFKGISKDIVNILKNADIFVSSSLYEAAPLVILEAITVGIPIIATDIPPHREILGPIPNYNSFVPVKDHVAISQEVIKLVSNPKYYNEMSSSALTRSKDYSSEKLIDNYHNFYLSQVRVPNL